MEPSKPKTVLLYGMSGAGKGTQARLLMEMLNKNHGSAHFIETGQLLRDYAYHAGTFGARRIRETIDGGNLVPQAISTHMWASIMLKSVGEYDHVVFDGAARSIIEAELLNDMLTWFHRDADIFVLQVDHDVALKRALERGQHRADDTEEGMKNRLAWFNERTMPAIDRLKALGARVHMIDGNKSVQEVHAGICAILCIA